MSQEPPKNLPQELKNNNINVLDYFNRLTNGLYFLWDEFRNGLVRYPTYTVAGVPDAAKHVRRIIYVSDETGGATLAFSDGTSWRRVQDRNVIST